MLRTVVVLRISVERLGWVYRIPVGGNRLIASILIIGVMGAGSVLGYSKRGDLKFYASLSVDPCRVDPWRRVTGANRHTDMETDA